MTRLKLLSITHFASQDLSSFTTLLHLNIKLSLEADLCFPAQLQHLGIVVEKAIPVHIICPPDLHIFCLVCIDFGMVHLQLNASLHTFRLQAPTFRQTVPCENLRTFVLTCDEYIVPSLSAWSKLEVLKLVPYTDSYPDRLFSLGNRSTLPHLLRLEMPFYSPFCAIENEFPQLQEICFSRASAGVLSMPMSLELLALFARYPRVKTVFVKDTAYTRTHSTFPTF
jgi:hypothetical protein